MTVVNNLLMGFGQAFTPIVLLYTMFGAIIGTAIGVLPGLGPAATIGLLLPVTFGMDPLPAMSMLVGIYYGAQYGGSTTSILLKMPGETASVITVLDGYEMAKQGRGGVALGISAIGSFIAGIISTFGLMLIGEPLSRAAINFGPPEYAVLMILGLSMATSLGGSQLKALIMCVMGILIATIGTDTFTGVERFTFGSVHLMSGFELVPILMGLIAFSELLKEIERGITANPEMTKISTRLKDLLPSARELKESMGAIIRGSIGGFLLGSLPGLGAATSSFMSYAVERRLSKNPEKFGNGAIQGVAGPESANNAGSNGAMVPLFALGIPGTTTAAILAGGLMMYGLVPGPLLFKEHPDFIYSLIATMFIGNAMLVILNLPLISIWIKMIKVPGHILLPLIFAFIIIGGYAISFSTFDLFVIAVSGLIGYIANKNKFPAAPFILGFFLGPMLEANIRKALIISRGDPLIFFERPISIALSAVIVLVVVAPGLLKVIKQFKGHVPQSTAN